MGGLGPRFRPQPAVKPLARELAQYAQFVVANGRVGASVRTAAAEWRRRRTVVSKTVDIAVPDSRRSIDGRSVEWPLLSLEAGGRLEDSAVQWDVVSRDPEALWRVHRFGWILERLAARPTRATALECLDAVREWTTHPSSCDRRVLDSYSLSERLANWSFLAALLLRAGDRSATDDAAIRASVDAQGARLIGSLEEHGAGYTNNHLLANLRALFWYGTIWNAPAHRRAAARLAADALPRLFTPCGFLREASSHYHLLLTRSLIEMQRLAHVAADDEATELLAPWVARTTNAAAFLTAGGRVPLVGDVSPDFPPEWFSDGWHTLWTGESAARAVPRHHGFTAFPDAGWYRMTVGSVALLWHVNPDGAVGPRSHGHVDLGSFELLWSGKPMVVDPGRPTYAASSWDARRGSSHNTITVDAYDPMLAWGVNGYPTAMDRRYWDPRASLMATDCRATLRHHGFERLARGLVVERQFTASDRRLDIVDVVERAEGRVVDSYLQIAPDVAVRRVGPSDLEFVAPDLSLTARWTCDSAEHTEFDLLSATSASDTAGWFSPRYGQQVPATTIRLRAIGGSDYHAHLTITERSA